VTDHRRTRHGDVLGLAVPPSRPVPGRGRPRTQVEPGSLGSGRPPTLSDPAATADPADVADLRLPELTDAGWAALRQLADAPDAVVARWPVGRAVALALVRRGLVNACSEWVWLSEAGLMALDAVREPISPSTPNPLGPTPSPPEQAARPTPPPAETDRRAQPSRPARRPAGGDVPPGVLLRAARAHGASRP